MFDKFDKKQKCSTPSRFVAEQTEKLVCSMWLMTPISHFVQRCLTHRTKSSRSPTRSASCSQGRSARHRLPARRNALTSSRLCTQNKSRRFDGQPNSIPESSLPPQKLLCSHLSRNGFSPHKKGSCSITQLFSRPPFCDLTDPYCFVHLSRRH